MELENLGAFLSACGLAANAKKLIYGELLFDKIKADTIRLVVMTYDVSAKQKSTLRTKCDNHGILCYEITNLSSAALSGAIGKTNIKAIGLDDVNFTKLIKSKL